MERPAGLDILITHGPPYGVLDVTPRGDLAGCEELRKKVDEVLPRVHIFGHIHHGYGILDKGPVKFVNASTCDEEYFPSNPPIIFDI